MKFNYLSDGDQDSSSSEFEDLKGKHGEKEDTGGKEKLINPFDIA